MGRTYESENSTESARPEDSTSRVDRGVSCFFRDVALFWKRDWLVLVRIKGLQEERLTHQQRRILGAGKPIRSKQAKANKKKRGVPVKT